MSDELTVAKGMTNSNGNYFSIKSSPLLIYEVSMEGKKNITGFNILISRGIGRAEFKFTMLVEQSMFPQFCFRQW